MKKHPETAAITMQDTLAYFWPYNMRYGLQYWLYIISQILSVLIAGIIMPLYLRSFIDLLIHNGSLQELHSVLLGIASWSIANIFTLISADYFISNVAPKVIRDLENDCFKHIHRLSLQYFAGTHVGGLVSKVKRFSTAYNTLDLHITRGLLSSVVQISATIIVVGIFSPLLAFVFAAWGILYVLAVLAAIRLKMRLDIERVRLDTKASGHLADSITNFLTVKIFSRFGNEEVHFKHGTQKVAQATIYSWYASMAISAIQSLIVGIVSVLILFLGLRYWQDGAMTVGTIVLLQTYVYIIGSNFIQLGEQLKSIYRAYADAVEMMEILQQKPSVQDPAHPQKSEIGKGLISINAITFGYNAAKPVFKNFSLTIPSGQRIGIVGRSGAGKSSLIALLMRFIDVQKGQINIDGQDIRKLLQDDLRSHISYVPQEPLLFHRSIRENIAYSKPSATEDEIINAAQKAHADEFIQNLPEGYNTIVGERGIKLSGGERQRITIARTMLKDSPILILDEATSSLDSVSENYIRDAFDILVSNRTTVVIAHRLSTIQRMDRIIVLENGKIAEDGSHKELLSKNGLYAELWNRQSDGFLGE